MSQIRKSLNLLFSKNHAFFNNYSNLNNGGNNLKLFIRNISTASSLFEKVSFKLSDIGEGIREVVVKEWYVKVGDKVAQFDNICEVQSDKASVTITSRYDGVITKLYYKVDEVALVGQPLVDLETDDKAVEPTISKESSVEEKKESIPETVEKKEEPVITTTKSSADPNFALCIPSVRRLSKQYKLDLSKIKGTGKGGRILKEDVLKYMEENKTAGSPAPSTVPSTPKTFIKPLEDKVEPIKGFQKAMVKTMTDSLKIPHFVYSDEVIVTKLSKQREQLKTIEGIKLSFMPFFIKAASNCLSRFPIINASIDEKCENIYYKASHNIGVAMDTKIGLAVPVIKNCQQLSVMEIATELDRLIKSGKDGVFAPEDLAGGTFTISNIGIVGGTYTKPVIVPPQVAIVALGKTQTLPRFDKDLNVVAEEIVNISASADHRIIDGVSMAKFIKHFKKQIEEPFLLYLNL